MYIVIAILAFGLLIASHELGHFLAAKSCGVKVNEFAIGMGPAILKKQKGETLYSVRVLPIGGFCAMEGEDEDTHDPRAFTAQSPLKRIFILVAGALMNFLLGLIIVILIFSNASEFAGTTVTELVDGFQYSENGLEVGDKIVSIDGHHIFYADDFSTYMSRSTDGAVNMTVIRDGERVTLADYGLQKETYTVDGEEVSRYGVTFNEIEPTLGAKLNYSLYTSYNFVRYVQMGLSDLVSGAVGVNQLTGVVGIVGTINDVGTQSANTSAALINVAYLCAFIAVNLAVMNLLPLPALDGGRIFLLLVTWVIEKISGRKVNPKYEGYIHAAGMVILLALMVFVTYNDIIRLIH